MNDTPRVNAKSWGLDLTGPEQYENYIEMAILARTLEGELNIANENKASLQELCNKYERFVENRDQIIKSQAARIKALAEKPMSDTPRVDEKIIELVAKSQSGLGDCFRMTILARTLERELQAANKIIAGAAEYIEEFRDMFPDNGLMAILERREQQHAG